MANARQVAPHPLSCLIRSLICLSRRHSGPVIWGRGFAVGSRSRSSCFRPLVLVVMYLLCARAHALLVVRCAVRSLNVTLQLLRDALLKGRNWLQRMGTAPSSESWVFLR